MILRVGSTGQAVTDWQNFLNAQGFNVGTADGIFGHNTKTGSQAFQTAHGLTADGVPGPATFAAAEKLGFSFTDSSASDTEAPAAAASTIIPPDGMINAVVDVSHHNGSDLDFAAAKACGILGVIHKATQGSSYTDPMYNVNRPKATAAGCLWGAYHFGTAQDVAAQVDNFLTAAAADANTLLVLDWESNSIASQGTMTLAQAVEFVTLVHARAGRWPVLYGGSTIKKDLAGTPNGVLSNCPLWIAAYNDSPTLPPGWDEYTMWQYTDGEHGNEPHSAAGIGNCDRDVYRGTAAGLAAWWKSGL